MSGKVIRWAAVCLLVVVVVGCSDERKVSFGPNGGFRFWVPPDYLDTSPDDGLLLTGRGGRMKMIVKSESNTFIAYGYVAMPISAHTLEVETGLIVDAMNRGMPGLEWEERKVIAKAGRRWTLLEFSFLSEEGDTFECIWMTTTFGGGVATVSFYAPADEFAAHEEELRSVIASFRLRD